MSENELFKIPEEALKKIKTQEEFEESYSGGFTNKALKSLLKAEINEHLGYPKHDPSGKNSGNSRNGFSQKDSENQPWRSSSGCSPGSQCNLRSNCCSQASAHVVRRSNMRLLRCIPGV